MTQEPMTQEKWAQQKLILDLAFEVRGHTVQCRETIGPGITGVFGPSGAGKSTLLRLIAGLHKGASGRIQFGPTQYQNSDSKTFLPPQRRRIGYVPQHSLLFPHLDVAQNLASSRPGISDGERTRVVSLLGLGGLLTRPVQTLSGGERQRVALARGLCAGPQLLLLDEPLSAVDLNERSRLWGLLKAWISEHQQSALWVSHDPVEIQAVADQLLMIDKDVVLKRQPQRALVATAHGPGATEQGGYNNLLPGTIDSADGPELNVKIGADSLLRVADQWSPREPTVRVVIPARSMILAAQAPGPTSARNVFRVTLAEIDCGESFTMVKVDLEAGNVALWVELGATTLEALKLGVGSQAYVLIKSTACRLLPS